MTNTITYPHTHTSTRGFWVVGLARLLHLNELLEFIPLKNSYHLVTFSYGFVSLINFSSLSLLKMWIVYFFNYSVFFIDGRF